MITIRSQLIGLLAKTLFFLYLLYSYQTMPSIVTNIITSIVCPLLGMIIANFMWLSPMSMMLKARASRDIGSINPYPFAVTVLNCLGWLIYGCQLKDFYIFWANLPGIILGLYNCIICLTILAKKSKEENFSDKYLYLENLLLFAFFFWALMAMISATAFNDKEGTAMIGYLCCAFAIAYYAAPLSTMVQVITTLDASSLYLPTILLNLVNALMWGSYGIFAAQDINLWLPNALGVLLASCQVIMVFVYSKGSLWNTLIGKKVDSVDVPIGTIPAGGVEDA